ncbi:MAG TPA: diguanylate cyclase [Acidobacteriaceae bacterium]|nr:diguanylate cyclase [Acidobacteriaceae bacterium]
MNTFPVIWLHWLLGTSIVFSGGGLISFGFWAAELRRKRREEQFQNAMERLRKQTMQDGLTGLFNRRYFDEALGTEWKRAARENQSVALLLLDVDCFKKLNDRYGQIPGDDCLHKVAAVLKENIHRPGDFVARIGGEEFAVVLPGASAEGAFRIAESMRTAVLNLKIPNQDSSAGPYATLSIGVCSKPSTFAQAANKLVEGADAALYLAKVQGRNRTQLSGALAPMAVMREQGVALAR